MFKVYCIDCKHLKNCGGMCEPPVYECDHPGNKKLYKMNWLRKWYKCVNKPKHINKYNNCVWFLQKK